MQQKCSKSDQLWEILANTLSIDEQNALDNHLLHCNSCSSTVTKINDWKNDKAEDNPFLTQKILDRISNADIQYSNSARMVVRWASLIAIVIGVSLGFLMQISLVSDNSKVTVVDNDYKEKIENFSSEIHYSDMKTNETQLLLTNAR